MTQQSRSFGTVAQSYEAGRPDYPIEAVAWLLGLAPAHRRLRVVDVGAGTGKLSRVVVELGGEVVAVDPDPQMLLQLNASVPGVPTFLGTAERLPLPDASVDAVLVGQAWHWVEPVAGCAEIGRVLRPGGVLGLIWNLRDETTPWVERLGAVMRNQGRGDAMIPADGPPIAAPFTDFDAADWSWVRPMTRAALLDLVSSRSYVITADEAERARIDAGIGELMDELGLDGERVVDLPYRTYAFRCLRP